MEKTILVATAAITTVALMTTRRFLYNRGKKKDIEDVVNALLRKKGLNVTPPGRKRLVVIADFDRTLSRFRTKDGREGVATHGVLENYAPLGAEYVAKANALKEKYLPLENAEHLSFDERKGICEEWWSRAHGLLLHYGIRRIDVQKAVAEETRLELREGCEDFFKILIENDIPLLIFSAGLADIIESYLATRIFSVGYETKNTTTNIPSNIHVISNRMVFEGPGSGAKLVDFASETIHSCNKGTVVLKSHSHLSAVLEGRDTVLLLGDSMGDVHMADSLEKSGKTTSTTKIGFLNSQIKEALATYESLYDAVIVNDGTMDIPVMFLKRLLGGMQESTKKLN